MIGAVVGGVIAVVWVGVLLWVAFDRRNEQPRVPAGQARRYLASRRR